MEPEEFLSREAFESLNEDERDAYTARFFARFEVEFRTARTAERVLDYTEHYLDVLEWTLSPEEFEHVIGRKLWDTSWENAEKMLETLDEAIASGELSDEQCASATELRERVRVVVEHKRQLGDLPEAGS